MIQFLENSSNETLDNSKGKEGAAGKADADRGKCSFGYQETSILGTKLLDDQSNKL